MPSGANSRPREDTFRPRVSLPPHEARDYVEDGGEGLRNKGKGRAPEVHGAALSLEF